MPPKRSADEFLPRRSKRAEKGAPAATTISPDAGPLEDLLASLRKNIQETPQNFIIPGLDAALDLTHNVKLLNIPSLYNKTLEVDGGDGGGRC
jgi:hypothetical protein